MSEVIDTEYTIEQLRSLRVSMEALENSFAWTEYLKYIRAQEHNRIQQIMQGPDVVPLDKIDYLRGESMGLRIAQGFMDLLRRGLADELAIREQQDADRKPVPTDDARQPSFFDDSDIFGHPAERQLDALARASRSIDPGSGA